jgi:YfiH family protein
LQAAVSERQPQFPLSADPELDVTTPVDDYTFGESAAGRILTFPALAGAADHLVTTRVLDFRGDRASADYARVASALDVNTEALITVSQVHGRQVLIVRPGLAIPDALPADAIVSTDPSRAIAVRVADCVPILLADRKGRAVAAVHAGWRGSCAGVAAAAVQALEEEGVPPSDLIAAIGPSIGPCCYQVDDRVRTTFLGMTPDAAAWLAEDGPGHWRLDLWTANRDQLENAGVSPDAIHAAPLCTRDHDADFFSYRREGAGAGRMVAAIRLAAMAGKSSTVRT